MAAQSGMRDTGELVNQPHVQVSGSSSHGNTPLLGGTPMGKVHGGKGVLHGTSLWDVKATLGKRWRGKLSCQKSVFKRGLEVPAAGMRGTAALIHTPDPTPQSLLWGNSTAHCTQAAPHPNGK